MESIPTARLAMRPLLILPLIYSRGETTGPDGHTSSGPRLKRHLQKDGTEVHHQYLANGQINETRYPNGSVRHFSELTEEGGEDTRVRTAIERINRR